MGWVFQLASLVALLTSTLAGEESGPELPDAHLHLHAGVVEHHQVCSGTKRHPARLGNGGLWITEGLSFWIPNLRLTVWKHSWLSLWSES